MRTNVHLDDDVLKRPDKESKGRDASSHEGLVAVERTRESRKPLVVIPRSIGLEPGFNFDSISLLLAIVESEDPR